MAERNLSDAIELYLGFGILPSPGRDPQRVTSLFGHDIGAKMIEEIETLLTEINQTEIDWEYVSLETAGQQIRSQLVQRHLGLSGRALDAIGWYFTYSWR